MSLPSFVLCTLPRCDAFAEQERGGRGRKPTRTNTYNPDVNCNIQYMRLLCVVHCVAYLRILPVFPTNHAPWSVIHQYQLCTVCFRGCSIRDACVADFGLRNYTLTAPADHRPFSATAPSPRVRAQRLRSAAASSRARTAARSRTATHAPAHSHTGQVDDDEEGQALRIDGERPLSRRSISEPEQSTQHSNREQLQAGPAA